MKLPSAMILWGESLDLSVSQMEGILSVFKFIGKKIGRFWIVLSLGKRSKQLYLMRHISLQNGNKFYSTYFHNKHIDTLELYTL